jgi:heme-degrading monooxygenase HmoA
MVHVLVHHKIADYNRWKTAFDSDLTARKHAGETGFRVFYNAEDAHDIFLLSDWESVEAARKFMNSQELKDRMQRAGVQVTAEIRYLEDVRAVHRSAAD